MSFSQMYDKLIPLMPMNPNSTINAKLLGKYNPASLFGKYSIFWGKDRYTQYFIEHQEFPVELTDPRGDPGNLDKIKISSHRGYFEIGKKACLDACKYFNI